MSNQNRNFANPWPRMALACVLTVWAGANVWSSIFRMSDIISDDIPSRTIGMFLAILFAVLPMVIAIYLFWTVVVGPDDVGSKDERNRGASKNTSPSGKQRTTGDSKKR